MKVVVIGVGHIGLVTAAALAQYGHDVVGLDDDRQKIDGLASGRVPFFEPGLQELVNTVTASGKLAFATDYPGAFQNAEVAFICVGTPARPDGEANLVAVENSARAAAKASTGDIVLAQKSTVPVRTADRLKKLFAGEPAGRIRMVSNPEFLREGTAVKDSLEPDRILVGADDDQAHEAMRRIYAPLREKGVPYFATDIRTAELAKHACNAFLAMKISFANALARICEASGADVVDIADIMGADRRIGRDFLDAGLGYGGYCLPKDVAAFRTNAARLGYDFGLLAEVMKINEHALQACFDKVEESVWNLDGKRIVLLGLSFKGGTDDIRESPSLHLAAKLLGAGALVVGYDPHANAQASAEVPGLVTVDDLYEGAEGAHCIVICTDASEFAALDLSKLKGLMSNPVIVDARNLLDAEAVAQSGFTYVPTGRPPVNL